MNKNEKTRELTKHEAYNLITGILSGKLDFGAKEKETTEIELTPLFSMEGYEFAAAISDKNFWISDGIDTKVFKLFNREKECQFPVEVELPEELVQFVNKYSGVDTNTSHLCPSEIAEVFVEMLDNLDEDEVFELTYIMEAIPVGI